LPGETAADAGIYTKYRVLKPIKSKTGIAAPWFGKPGGATQHMTNMSIRNLIRHGYLEVID
jgi:filamentous hemagglutinin